MASLVERTTAVVHSSSCASRHLVVLRKDCCSQEEAIACKAAVACNITVVSLLKMKLQASKVDDKVARTCFKVEVSTYITTIQGMEATFTSKAARTCSN
jgi:hypothetical protein